jgi:hypothetical protein
VFCNCVDEALGNFLTDNGVKVGLVYLTYCLLNDTAMAFMVLWLMNNQLKVMCKEMITAFFKELFRL